MNGLSSSLWVDMDDIGACTACDVDCVRRIFAESCIEGVALSVSCTLVRNLVAVSFLGSTSSRERRFRVSGSEGASDGCRGSPWWT